MGSHNPPLWSLASTLALVPFVNRYGISQSTPFGPSVLAGTPPSVHLFRARYPSLLAHRLVSTPFGAHRPSPPSRPSVLASIPPMSTPFSLTIFLASTLTGVHPYQGSPSLLTHCSASGSNTTYNGSNPLLIVIVFLWFSPIDFPSRFLKYVC